MGFFDRFFGPPSEDKFAQIMTAALRKAGDKRETTYDKDEFRLRHFQDGKQNGVMNLRNLYLGYCKTPKADRAEWLQRTCSGMLNRMELPEDFDDVRPDLMPTVRCRSMVDSLRYNAALDGLASKRSTNPAELVWLPLTENLVICFVYDLPNSMRFVTPDDFKNWGVTSYEALEVARQNLAEREFAMMALGEKIYIIENGDAYDATRMLLTQQIRSLPLAGQPVALAITRDCLLLTGADDVEGITLLGTLAKAKLEEPRPLCAIAMTLVDDQWENWLPPAEHPAYKQFVDLELRQHYGEYDEQKKSLEKQNAAVGEDIFVASFCAIERDELLVSFSVWPKDIVTWLPRTKYVALNNADANANVTWYVRWENLQRVAGDLMEPLDYFPPRWLVTEFPTPQQIAQMEPENWTK